MSTLPSLRTAAQARAHLDELGISIAEFARRNDLKASVVYQVLRGDKQGRYGQAHRAAVALGMKRGITPGAED